MVKQVLAWEQKRGGGGLNPTPGSSPDSICNENIKMGVVMGVVVGGPLIRSTLLIENLGSATVCYTFKFSYRDLIRL